MKVSEVFEQAAAIIEDAGWCQGSYGYKRDEPHCIVGAISTAALHTALGQEAIGFLHSHGVNSGWNDRPGRTEDEVIDLLLKLAAEARWTEE